MTVMDVMLFNRLEMTSRAPVDSKKFGPSRRTASSGDCLQVVLYRYARGLR